MAIIFEGTFAELQKRVHALPLPLGERVRLVSDVPAEKEPSLAPKDDPTAEDASALYFDRIKEMAEDDDDYFLRFYRSSGHY